MSIQLLRNTRVFASTVESGFTAQNTFEILVGDDLSFSQDSSNTDIAPNEAGPKPVRGSKRFIDALNPASWSFSTYLIPIAKTSGGNEVYTPDAILWHCLASGSPFDPAQKDKGVYQNDTNQIVSFKDNAYHELTMLHLFMLVDQVWYKVKNVQVGQAEISCDIADIGKTTWSGNGTDLQPLDAEPTGMLALGVSDAEFIRYQPSYIKNKLSILNIKDNKSGGKTYDVALTAATVTINNNITYLTPNTLNRVDRAIGSFTGSFDVTGNITCYVNTKANGSSQLWKDLVNNTSSVNSFSIAICMGGKYADKMVPGVVIHMPTAIIQTPSTSSEDIISLSLDIKAQGSDLDAGDEVRICMGDKLNATKIDAFLTTGDAKPAAIV